MSINYGVINLTSDEEEKDEMEPQRKRIKLISLDNKCQGSTVVISSDEETTIFDANDSIQQTVDVDEQSEENDERSLADNAELLDLDYEEVAEADGEGDCEEVPEEDSEEQVEAIDNEEQLKAKQTDPEGAQSDKESFSRGEKSREPRGVTQEEQNASEHLEAYFKACSASIEDSKYESLRNKFPALQKLYEKYIHEKGNGVDVKKLLDKQIQKASQSAADAVLSFDEVFSHFGTVSMEEDTEIAPEHLKKVKLLLKTCLKLIQKIRKLECAEVNWDDENDSAYIQEDRYKQRLLKVFTQYCKYVNMNPYAGRLTYKKFKFVSSKYSEINEAINKNYQTCRRFPTYLNMEKVIRQAVERHSLSLSEGMIKKESEMCFKALGEFLQKRRKQELYENHYYFIRDSNDPAQLDEQLERCLKENFADGMEKIESICEKFVEKQMTLRDAKSEADSSADSDDSHYIDSDNS